MNAKLPFGVNILSCDWMRGAFFHVSAQRTDLTVSFPCFTRWGTLGGLTLHLSDMAQCAVKPKYGSLSLLIRALPLNYCEDSWHGRGLPLHLSSSSHLRVLSAGIPGTAPLWSTLSGSCSPSVKSELLLSAAAATQEPRHETGIGSSMETLGRH